MRTSCWLGLLALAVPVGAAWADAAADKEREKLAGTWAATAAEDYGEKVPEEKARSIRLVLSGNEFTASDGETTVMSGTFAVDPGKKPKTIDLMSTAGRHEGKTLEGVYELDGDTLKICFVEPGAKRPKELVSTLDDGAFLMVCKREKR
jgi:uncharacterized protein (TIGR03067 family)